jgi:hypothetical protein
MFMSTRLVTTPLSVLNGETSAPSRAKLIRKKEN